MPRTYLSHVGEVGEPLLDGKIQDGLLGKLRVGHVSLEKRGELENAPSNGFDIFAKTELIAVLYTHKYHRYTSEIDT